MLYKFPGCVSLVNTVSDGIETTIIAGCILKLCIPTADFKRYRCQGPLLPADHFRALNSHEKNISHRHPSHSVDDCYPPGSHGASLSPNSTCPENARGKFSILFCLVERMIIFHRPQTSFQCVNHLVEALNHQGQGHVTGHH